MVDVINTAETAATADAQSNRNGSLQLQHQNPAIRPMAVDARTTRTWLILYRAAWIETGDPAEVARHLLDEASQSAMLGRVKANAEALAARYPERDRADLLLPLGSGRTGASDRGGRVNTALERVIEVRHPDLWRAHFDGDRIALLRAAFPEMWAAVAVEGSPGITIACAEIDIERAVRAHTDELEEAK